MESVDKYIDVKDISNNKIKPVKPRFIIPQDQIVKYFSEVSSKTDVLKGFLEFGKKCFSNLAIFSVFQKSIQLLRGEGENIKEPHFMGTFGVDKNTIVRRAIVNKYPYKGPIPVGSDEKQVFRNYFNRFAEEVFLYPGSIRCEETDILFYCDTFQQDRESTLMTFEYVVEKTIQALRFLWIKKQLTTI